jgi:hypothetical protein
MTKNKETQKLKSELGDISDIIALEEATNTEFFVKLGISQYIVYSRDEDVLSICGISDEGSISFMPSETDQNYQDYLAWVEQGNVAEEIAL